MKKQIICFALIAAFGIVNSYSQCTPNVSCIPNGIDFGICPDSATGTAVGTTGVAYNQVLSVKSPATAAQWGTPSATVDSLVVISIDSLAPGLSFQCPGGNCAFPGGTNGCILISGTPTQVWNHTIIIHIHAYVALAGFHVDAGDKPNSQYRSIVTGPHIPPVANFTGAPTTLCKGQSLTYTDSTFTSTSWAWTFPGGTPASSSLQNPVIVYDSSGTFSATLIASNSYGSDTITKTNYILVNSLPVVSSGGLASSYCLAASTQTLTGSPVGGTFSGNGISGNTFNPTFAGSGTQTIAYIFIDGNGCSDSSIQITDVLPLPTAPPICMVTTDSLSINNIIYWDKTPYTNIDSFIVYRETVSNTYKRIGAVSMNSLSLLVDTVRHLYFPFTGNPNAGTYRYKLQIRDTCGNYSPLSPYHNTIYVAQTGGTFNWNAYQIEGEATPIPQLTSYYLYRDNNGTGVWTLVNGVSGSQLTINDPDYALYPNANWRIETQWTIACAPTRSTVHSARSNIKGHTVGIAKLNEPIVNVSIYPNPFSGNTTITYSLNKKSDVSVEVYNAIGQKVETLVNITQSVGEYKYNFSAKQKENNTGIYFVKVTIDGNTTMKRIVEME